MRWVFGIWIGLFLVGTMPAWGVDWQYYAKGDDYDLFYDADSITYPDKSHAKVWVKVAFDEDTVRRKIPAGAKIPNDDEFFSYQKVSVEIDCQAKRQRNLTINNYSKNGKYLSSPPASNLGNWQVIVPDSFGDTLSKKVCK